MKKTLHSTVSLESDVLGDVPGLSCIWGVTYGYQLVLIGLK